MTYNPDQYVEPQEGLDAEAMFNQHKAWEAEQEFHASESAKAEADIQAQEEEGRVMLTDTTRESLEILELDERGIQLIHITKGEYFDYPTTNKIELDPDQIDKVFMYLLERVERGLKKEINRNADNVRT